MKSKEQIEGSTPARYSEEVRIIKTAILQAQYDAAKGVNRVQLALYYGVGRYISRVSRNADWGTGALKYISSQLQRELPGLRGFSEANLRKMRLFYENWQCLDNLSFDTTNETKVDNSFDASNELQKVEDEAGIYKSIQIPDLKTFPVEDFFRVPFSHHILIFSKEKSQEARFYYIRRTAEEHLSVGYLERLIDEDAYNCQQTLPNNFSKTLTAEGARKAVMMFKDEYLLNFINVEEIGERDKEDIDERVVEQAIVHNIKNFIMAFGNGFAFIGNQVLLEVYGVEHFPDLLFFNRELNALVVIELKTGEFKSSYLGQLTVYLRILDDKLRKPHESPSVGIVLCRSFNKEYVQYVIQDYSKPMGVAAYKTSEDMPEKFRKALPNVEDLRRIISKG